MTDQLQQYIVAQEHAGYSEGQIRAALLAQGYPQEQVDTAFKALHSPETDSIIRDYVQQYARQGSTPVQIFKELTTQGYSSGKVRKAIQEVFGAGTMQSHHTIVFIVIALVIVGGGFYFMNLNGVLTPIEPRQPGPGQEELSVSEQIAQIIIIARTQGKDAAMKECQLRLRNDNRDLCYLDIAVLDGVGDYKLCDQIADVQHRDVCLMQFFETNRTEVCPKFKLQENIEVCNAVAALKSAKST